MTIIATGGFSDGFSPPASIIIGGRRVTDGNADPTPPCCIETLAQTARWSLRPLAMSPTKSNSSCNDDDGSSSEMAGGAQEIATAVTTTSTCSSNEPLKMSAGLDKIFQSVDVDNSGSIDYSEYSTHLSAEGYSDESIRRTFNEMDVDGNGEISRDEFRMGILTMQQQDEECPMGYWLNSVKQTCQPLSPLGRLSQKIETAGPLRNIYKKVSNVFGIDYKKIARTRGISFFLAYSIISNLNGAISLSVAWYMTVKRTGVSPLVPGQKKSLLASYAMIYGALQLLKPFRVAAAVAMSKVSAEYLDVTQERFQCSRNVAIGCQYLMGQFMMAAAFAMGVTVVSLVTGVPPQIGSFFAF